MPIFSVFAFYIRGFCSAPNGSDLCLIDELSCHLCTLLLKRGGEDSTDDLISALCKRALGGKIALSAIGAAGREHILHLGASLSYRRSVMRERLTAESYIAAW